MLACVGVNCDCDERAKEFEGWTEVKQVGSHQVKSAVTFIAFCLAPVTSKQSETSFSLFLLLQQKVDLEEQIMMDSTVCKG